MDINTNKLLQQKIISSVQVRTTINTWKSEGEKIVFTNGVFDVLHIGHITYLAAARELGDKLILGVNSDASVKRLKGNDRPINTENNRALLLAALFFVDAIILFEEDTPLNLIKQVMPKILVKGADYTIENIVGAKEVMQSGGRVETIKFVEGQSSTNIINKLKNITAQ